MLYTVRVWKRLVSQPTVEWNNSYEMSSGDVVFTSSEMVDHANHLVDFESALYFQSVEITRVVFSTWEEDSDPYNPDNLKTVDYSAIGSQESLLNEKEALDTVLKLKRSVDFGRSGKIELRGCLINQYVDTDSGQPALSAYGRTAIASALSSAITGLAGTMTYMVMAGKSQTDKIYEATPAGQKQVVRREYTNDIHIRPIRGFVVNGVARRTLNNMYFDKV